MSKGMFFVYGTLKEGGALSHQFNKDRQSAVKATLNGHDLFNLGWFPGIKPGEGVVQGELHVYGNSERVTNRMDQVEGYRPENEESSLFVRKTVVVTDEDGNEHEASVYLFNRQLEKDYAKIEDGNWPI